MSYNTGATFVPGGDDSYYMPELIQPTPNRAYDLPQNIQHNVAQMEQAASSPNSAYSGSVYSPQSAEYLPSAQHAWGPDHTRVNPAPVPNHTSMLQPTQHDSIPPRSTPYSLPEQPNFSPFPVLRNPPSNIPPNDEQKEVTLEAARVAVLACNDPDTQLTWAQDALSYVEACEQNEERIALAQTPRSRTPRIEHVLREDAMKIVEFLADQHHPHAEFIKGMWLEFGKFGHRIDKKEAFHCYTRASERGYIRADYRIGMQFESSNDALKAIKFYQKGADAGDSAACYRLGMMTLLGQHGQPQDYQRGLNLIFASAQTADENAPQGAYVFGMLQAHQMPQVHVPETFLPKDVAAAKVNIEKAAYLGFAKAQVKMGQAYELCELDCPFDPALSLHYNSLAARQGEPEAELAISKWFLCGYEGLFDKNEEMAFTYAQRAALSGFGLAQFALGYYYEVGIYVPVDFAQAKEWYRKASQSGNQDATGRIDAISRSKTLSRKDHESVALNKIRQQRGSSRSGRTNAAPDVPPLPAVSESAAVVDMPDPSRLSISDQRPPSARPGSTAPYPLGPQNMPNATKGPEIRPTSAFGINPNLRSGASAPMAPPRADSYAPPNLYGQPRPPSSSDGRLSAAGYGRGGGRGSPAASPGQGGSQGRPSSRLGAASPHPHPDPRSSSPAVPAPKLDIGYSAPLEEERTWRTQQSNGQLMGKPQPPLPNPENPPRSSSRPNAVQSPGAPGTNRPGNTGARPMDRPNPGKDHAFAPNARPPLPKPPVAPQQNVRPANMAPTKPNPNAPSGHAPPSKPTSVPANAVRRQGKGPKTFDEMGVPHGKENRDCIVQ